MINEINRIYIVKIGVPSFDRLTEQERRLFERNRNPMVIGEDML